MDRRAWYEKNYGPENGRTAFYGYRITKKSNELSRIANKHGIESAEFKREYKRLLKIFDKWNAEIE